MSSVSDSKSKEYEKAGVSVERGDELATWLGQETKTKATNPLGKVVAGIGDFAALFQPDFSSFTKPLLVSSTDGVGTKLLLALENEKLDTIGIDLVAMCVNDLYCCGAQPLFFLDYFATGKLDTAQFKQVLLGIKSGLDRCQTALVGGETAEMPGLYQKGHFDLAGFVVGVVDAPKRLGAHLVKKGDSLLALESSGFHSNGFSLIRKWLGDKPGQGEKFRSKLLEPTRIYSFLPQILKELPWGSIHAMANITGGGLSGNLCRIMPENLQADILQSSLKTQAWMADFLRQNGASNPLDYEGVFNLGVGMVISVSDDFKDEITEKISKFCPCYEIGRVVDREEKLEAVRFS